MARYEIFVTYKKGIFDPPGATAERALVNLGYEGVARGQDRQVHPHGRRRRPRDRLGDVREAAREPGHRGLPHRDRSRRARPCASASSSSPAPTASRTSSAPRKYLGFEAEYIWHGDTDISGFDAIVLPGGFSYGDYIRTGAVARFSPGHGRGRALRREGRAGPRHLQRLPDPVRGAHAAGRAAAQPRPEVHLQGDDAARRGQRLPVARRCPPARVVSVPINHNEGNYICDAETLEALNANGQVVLRYARPTARPPPAARRPTARSTTSPASATSAATSSASCRTPSASSSPITGGTDGQPFFTTHREAPRRGRRLVPGSDYILGGPVWWFVFGAVRARRSCWRPTSPSTAGALLGPSGSRRFASPLGSTACSSRPSC